MDLELPVDSEEPRTRPLNKTDLRFIRRVLLKSDAASDRYVRPLVVTPDPTNEDPAVKELTEALHREYDGVVMGTEVVPDPPIRGPYGQAYIPLKEGAVPYRTRPFSMQGEKLEAHKKITRDWEEHKFIERPKAVVALEWLSSTFPVPKKSPDFPCRGVFDARGSISKHGR